MGYVSFREGSDLSLNTYFLSVEKISFEPMKGDNVERLKNTVACNGPFLHQKLNGTLPTDP